jgi:hypothetical protein
MAQLKQKKGIDEPPAHKKVTNIGGSFKATLMVSRGCDLRSVQAFFPSKSFGQAHLFS